MYSRYMRDSAKIHLEGMGKMLKFHDSVSKGEIAEILERSDNEGMKKMLGLVEAARQQTVLLPKIIRLLDTSSHFSIPDMGIFDYVKHESSDAKGVNQLLSDLRTMQAVMPYENYTISYNQEIQYDDGKEIEPRCFLISQLRRDLALIVPWFCYNKEQKKNSEEWFFPHITGIVSTHYNFSDRPDAPDLLMSQEEAEGYELEEGELRLVFPDKTKVDYHLCYNDYSGQTESELDLVKFAQDQMSWFTNWVFLPFLYLLNVKNIPIKTVSPNPKINKRRILNGKPPIEEYKILDLHLPNESPRYRESGGSTRNSPRVHLCRASMKSYLPERPLFGHYVGTVYCPPHTRGNKKLGIINKDYNVV